MGLNIQISSFISSFCFGCIFYYLLDLFNKFIMKRKIIWKVILSVIFIGIFSILYFIMLLYINNGYVHIYDLDI